MSQKIRNYLFMFSAILVLTGAVLYIIRWVFAPYFFAVGAAGVCFCFMTTPSQGLDFRFRRLHRINVLAGVSLLVSSVCLFRQKTEWVVFLLISSLLILYTSFIAPRSEK